MVAEDRQGMGRHGARRHMEDRRRQFAGDLVHVGNHEEQALRGREGRGQRPGLQGAMHGAGGAALGLQLDNPRHGAPDVGPALRRPFVGEFAHAGGRRDRINGDDFGNAVGHVGDGFIAVDRQLRTVRVLHD